MMKAVTIKERFDQVEKPDGECWIWKWAKNGAGRASFRGLSAPRRIYELAHGVKVPAHLGVLHSCDNPACVNPDHIWLGTQKDNMQDCSKKGRRNPNSHQSPGELHSLAKLTWNDVDNIRQRAAYGESEKDIAIAYPVVNRTQIGRIIRCQRWKPEQRPGQ